MLRHILRLFHPSMPSPPPFDSRQMQGVAPLHPLWPAASKKSGQPPWAARLLSFYYLGRAGCQFVVPLSVCCL